MLGELEDSDAFILGECLANQASLSIGALEHLDGKNLTIKIPAGTNSGETLEIRKRGLPGRRSGGRGDVIVLVKLHMPKKVDKKSKKALQELQAVLAPKDVIERIKQDAHERRA